MLAEAYRTSLMDESKMKKTAMSKMLKAAEFYRWLYHTEEVTDLLPEFIAGYTWSSSDNPVATFLKQKYSLHSVEIGDETLTLWNGECTEAYIGRVPEWAKQFLKLAGQQPYEEHTITVIMGDISVEIDLSKMIIYQHYDSDGDFYYVTERLMTNRRAISILKSLKNREVSRAINQVDTQREQSFRDYINCVAEIQRGSSSEWGRFHEDDMRNHFPDETAYRNWIDSSD
jgi:hypothetical protein